MQSLNYGETELYVHLKVTHPSGEVDAIRYPVVIHVNDIVPALKVRKARYEFMKRVHQECPLSVVESITEEDYERLQYQLTR